jgi:hypothetical protein
MKLVGGMSYYRESMQEPGKKTPGQNLARRLVSSGQLPLDSQPGTWS